MKTGNVVSECKFEFPDTTKPEFLGKYYKIYNENNEICYTDEIPDVSDFEGGM